MSQVDQFNNYFCLANGIPMQGLKLMRQPAKSPEGPLSARDVLPSRAQAARSPLKAVL